MVWKRFNQGASGDSFLSTLSTTLIRSAYQNPEGLPGLPDASQESAPAQCGRTMRHAYAARTM